MKTRQMIHHSLMAGVLFLAGCATDLHQRSTAANRTGESQVVTQEQARHLTAQYRRQASDLRELAQRTAWEAQWYASQFGADDQEASRRRLQSQQFWAAAEEADQLAREYRRQVPHGQIN